MSIISGPLDVLDSTGMCFDGPVVDVFSSVTAVDDYCHLVVDSTASHSCEVLSSIRVLYFLHLFQSYFLVYFQLVFVVH